jgi:hypothetical protein
MLRRTLDHRVGKARSATMPAPGSAGQESLHRTLRKVKKSNSGCWYSSIDRGYDRAQWARRVKG